MQYSKLGNSGLIVSRLAFGAMTFGTGIGPFAAMLSLCVGSVGMFGKLFADAIEQVDPAPGEAIAAAGAGRLQILRYAVLPQVLPSVVANSFYAFDVIVCRRATPRKAAETRRCSSS